ncbi:MAG TPA: LysR substrate-binding domain-containing protein, partial [Kofleriaceae bacterium]
HAQLERLVAYDHVGASRRGRFHGPVDAALRDHGLARRVVATVPTATAAAVAVSRGDWVTGLPRIIARSLSQVLPIAWFELPLALPPVTVAQTWHPRFDRDPAHRLLRDCVRAVAAQLG